MGQESKFRVAIKMKILKKLVCIGWPNMYSTLVNMSKRGKVNLFMFFVVFYFISFYNTALWWWEFNFPFPLDTTRKFQTSLCFSATIVKPKFCTEKKKELSTLQEMGSYGKNGALWRPSCQICGWCADGGQAFSQNHPKSSVEEAGKLNCIPTSAGI